MFDTKCYELAKEFLEGDIALKHSEKETNELAQRIQDAIEDWFKEKQS